MNDCLRILHEQRIGIHEARRLLGTEENPVHVSTVLRAMRRGHKTPNGERVRLEHLHSGGKIITSREAVERYIAELNGIYLDESAGSATSAPSKQRSKALASVDSALKRAGI